MRKTLFVLAFAAVVLPASASAQEAPPWDDLAECESGGNWSSNSGTYDGGLQFLDSTWDAYGGENYASTADQASREEQIAVAEAVLADVGWQAWPGCAAQLGLSGGGGGPSPEAPEPDPDPELTVPGEPTAPEEDASASTTIPAETQAQIDQQLATGALPPGL